MRASLPTNGISIRSAVFAHGHTDRHRLRYVKTFVDIAHIYTALIGVLAMCANKISQISRRR